MPRFTDFNKVYKLLDYYRECYPNARQIQDIPDREMKISQTSIYRYSKRLEELGYVINKGNNYYVWNPHTAGLSMPDPVILAMQWNLKSESNGNGESSSPNPAGNGNESPSNDIQTFERKDINNIKYAISKADTEKGKEELNEILMYHIMQFWRLMGSDNPNFHRSIIEQLIAYNSGPNPAKKLMTTLLKLTELTDEDQIKEALDTLQK